MAGTAGPVSHPTTATAGRVGLRLAVVRARVVTRTVPLCRSPTSAPLSTVMVAAGAAVAGNPAFQTAPHCLGVSAVLVAAAAGTAAGAGPLEAGAAAVPARCRGIFSSRDTRMVCYQRRVVSGSPCTPLVVTRVLVRTPCVLETGRLVPTGLCW